MDYTAMARACQAAATALQQLAAALEADPAGPCDRFTPPPGGGCVCQRCRCEWQDHPHQVVIPEGQLPVEELREQLAAGMVTVPYAKDQLPVVTGATKASLAEPECGCSLYTRCELHENGRARNCTCNGPTYRNSTCGIAEHRMVASSMPDRDPALLD